MAKRLTGKPPADSARAKARTPFSSYLAPDLLESYRDASYWLRVPLSDLIETALRHELPRLEKANGGAFKPRKAQLSPGRALRK